MNEGELMAHCVQRTCTRALQSNCNSHLVPSTRKVLAIDMVSFLHTSGTSTTSLSSARFIPDIVCISSIHFFLGRPLFLLPLPHASIVSFSIPFARITWPSSSVLLPSVSATKLLFLVRSPSVSTRLFSSLSKRPLASFSRSTFRRHQSIFFSISLVFVHVSQPYSITGKVIAFTIRIFFCKLTCLSFHIFSRPCIATLSSVILLRISFSHPPSHSTKAPKKEKPATTSISSPSTSKLLQLSVFMILVFLILKYIPAFSLSVLSFLMMTFNCSFFPSH